MKAPQFRVFEGTKTMHSELRQMSLPRENHKQAIKA